MDTLRFAEAARRVGAVARSHGLTVPVFRSPPGIEGVDRSMRRRVDGAAVVSIRLAGRPSAAVEADLIDGVIAANQPEVRVADAFRRSAWQALEGGLVALPAAG